MTCVDLARCIGAVKSRAGLVVGLLLLGFLLLGAVGPVGATGPEGGIAVEEGVVLGDPLEGFEVAGEHEIDVFRGKALGADAKIVTAQDLEGVVSGNVIEGTLTTGEVSIAPEAFSHFDGISSVIVNSGNNVSIQSSMVVNVTVEE